MVPYGPATTWLSLCLKNIWFARTTLLSVHQNLVQLVAAQAHSFKREGQRPQAVALPSWPRWDHLAISVPMLVCAALVPIACRAGQTLALPSERSLCLCGASFVGADVPGFFFVGASERSLRIHSCRAQRLEDPEPQLFQRQGPVVLKVSTELHQRDLPGVEGGTSSGSGIPSTGGMRTLSTEPSAATAKQLRVGQNQTQRQALRKKQMTCACRKEESPSSDTPTGNRLNSTLKALTRVTGYTTQWSTRLRGPDPSLPREEGEEEQEKEEEKEEEEEESE